MAKRYTGTFPGSSKGLNYVGKDHAYAYSGTFPGSTTSVDALLFTTGQEYIIGEFQMNIPIVYGENAATPGWMRILFNDEVIATVTVALVTTDSQMTSTQILLIPPYTNVKVEIVSDDNQPDRLMAATFSGRVYDA